MIVVAPDRRHLVIAGVVDGPCGVAGDELSFVPNLRAVRAEEARGGILDDRPILLRSVTAQADGRFYSARFVHVD